MGTDNRKERTRQAILDAMVTCLESQGFNRYNHASSSDSWH